MSSVECIWPAETILGEAPFWCALEKALYWVDMDGRAVLRWEPAGGHRRRADLGHEIGCIVRRASGGFVAGIDSGLAYLNSDLDRVDVFAAPEADLPNTRFNDGKCDRRGRFWVGSTDRNEVEPCGALYRVNGSGSVDRVLSDVIVSNGLGWSPDNKTMYFTDSGRGTIYRFDFDLETGALDDRQSFVTVDPEDGIPDGLAVDAEGYLWSAHWGGWRVTRYDPDGRIDRVVDLPIPRVTSLAFGGDDLEQLFITSARLGLSAGELNEAPLSGGLFVVEAGVRGLPEEPYGG